MSRCAKKKSRALVAGEKSRPTHAPVSDTRVSHLPGSFVWLRLANRGGCALRDKARRATLLALAGIALGGCDLHSSYYSNKAGQYVERADRLSMGGGDAVASNKVLQMQDPWPVASANRSLTTHGHVAASAMERYRTGKVTPPIGMSTSSTNYQGLGQSGQTGASSLSAVPITPSQATP